MPADFVVRSQTHSDGSEYRSYGSGDDEDGNFIPDHYVRRLWRKKVLMPQEGMMVTFTNKDTVDRRVTHSAKQVGGTLVIQEGNGNSSSMSVASEIARIEWAPGTGRQITKSPITISGQTKSVKDVLKRSNPFSDTRIFHGPDGIEYKWKVEAVGENPLYPDCEYRTLYTKDSKHPIATTQRLVRRDGEYFADDHSYPVYLSERALGMQDWIILTLVIIENLTK